MAAPAFRQRSSIPKTPDLRTALVYEVRIIVDDPDNRLRLGAPATVTIPLDQNAGTQPPEQPRP